MHDKRARRRFLKRMIVLAAGLSVGQLSKLAEAAPAKTTQPEPASHETTSLRQTGRGLDLGLSPSAKGQPRAKSWLKRKHRDAAGGLSAADLIAEMVVRFRQGEERIAELAGEVANRCDSEIDNSKLVVTAAGLSRF